MHDLINSIAVVQSVSPQNIQAAAVTSSAIDMQGCQSLAILAAVGTTADTLGASNRLDLKIEHADDNGAGAPGTYSACTVSDLVGVTSITGGIFASIDAGAKAGKSYSIAYVGGKRFVRVVATPVSLATGLPTAVLSVKSNLAQRPVQ